MSAAIGWGLIGASNIARQRIAGAIQRSRDGRLVAVASHSLPWARKFAQDLAIPHAYGSVAELLADERISAVYVSSTNQHHCEQVLAAAAAGRHVLCEKPLAMSLEQATAMVRACEAAGVVIATNHHLRNAVTIRAMRELVAQGSIGAPAAVMASHPAHVAAQDWRRLRTDSGAGVTMDVLVHTCDTVRFVLGQEPVEVSALGDAGPGMARGILDFIMATFRFDAGAAAQLHADFNSPNGRSRLEIHGPRGSLIGTDVLGKTEGFRGRLVLRRGGAEEEVAVESDDSRYARAVELFHAAVRGLGRPACTGADGVRSLAMVLAAEQAAGLRRTLPVSGAGLEFG